MKTIFVVFSLCFFAAGTLAGLTDEQKAKLRTYKDSCIQETGVDLSAVENAKNGQIDDNDEKLACFASCMLKKIGIMNPDGTVNEEVARSKIPAGVPQEKVEEVFTKCKNVSGATTCDKGRNLMKCFKDNKTFSVLQ